LSFWQVYIAEDWSHWKRYGLQEVGVQYSLLSRL